MRRIKILGLLLLASCGANQTTVDTDQTSTLNLSVNTAAASLSPVPSTSKGGGDFNFEVSPAAVTTGSVRCIATDIFGARTAYAGTLDGSGNCSIPKIPNNQEVICYLLNANGVITATISIGDSTAMGSIRDGFKISGNASANITYNSNTKAATSNCAASTCLAPSSGGTLAINLTGTWKMTCNGIRREDNGELDSSQSCPADLSGANVYLHRVTLSDSAGVIRYGYGAWPSQTAFTTCGSTEGLQSLPSGMTVGTSGQTGDFSWGAPFASFTSSSTSAQISTMIQNISTGPTLSYAQYQTQSCSGISTDFCVTQYFWAMVYPYISQNPGAICWPQIRANFSSTGEPTFSPDSSFGGTTQPMNRYDFMSTYAVGNQTYMKSFYTYESAAYDNAVQANVVCDVRSEILVSFTTPTSTPVAGSTSAVRFTQTTSVVSRTNTSAANTLCRNQVGSNSEWVTKGTYVDETLTFQ